MNIKSEQIRQVLVLLGSPEMVNSSHEMAIRTFINEYPYVQPAYYLLAKATLHQDTHSDLKSLAATYCPNGEILYRTIFQPYKFPKNTYLERFNEIKNEFENSNSAWSTVIQSLNTAVKHATETPVHSTETQIPHLPIEEISEIDTSETTEQNTETTPLIEAETPTFTEEISEENTSETIEQEAETHPNSELETPTFTEEISEENTSETIEQEAEIHPLAEVETPTLTEEIIEENTSETTEQEVEIHTNTEVETPTLTEEITEENTSETIEQEAEIHPNAEVETPTLTEEIIEENTSETTEQEAEIHPNAEVETTTYAEEISEENTSETTEQEAELTIEVKDENPQQATIVIPTVEIETFDHPDSVYNAIFNDSRFEHHVTQPETIQNPSVAQDEQQETENISAFKHSEKITSHTTPEEPAEIEWEPELETQNQHLEAVEMGHTQTHVSKYDDDAMPYSFLWWLQKTRKDYYENYQPFAKNVSPEAKQENVPAGVPEQKNLALLENQYKEHIFNLQTPFNIEDHLAERVLAPKKPKSLEIIDRFIKNEPQISAPVPNKLDNENKARVSTDESSELVTETLAKIYVEQMLYDKAIATYQKLSLKFPEKNRYFADLITQLEKRIY